MLSKPNRIDRTRLARAFQSLEESAGTVITDASVLSAVRARARASWGITRDGRGDCGWLAGRSAHHESKASVRSPACTRRAWPRARSSRRQDAACGLALVTPAFGRQEYDGGYSRKRLALGLRIARTGP